MNTEQLKTDRTKEEILEISIGNKYAKCIQKPFTDEYFYPTSAIYKAMQEFASQESKIAVEKDRESRWISVKERLPEEDGINVLVIVQDHDGFFYDPMTVLFADNKFQDPPDPAFREYAGKGITHWQPLPEPPKTVTP